ncbi:MAG: hypothetical protein ABFS37_14585, partial [Acidobacteriota bacterium]
AAAMVAAAAVVVVAVILVSETGRTGWMPWNRNSGESDRQIFALSNPPSRDPEAPIGAIESLLAREDPEPQLVEPAPLEVMGPLEHPPELPESGLALKVGRALIPVQLSAGFEGWTTSLKIEGGRVTSCQALDGFETRSGIDEVCREILALGVIGLQDGQFEAVVVGWDEGNTPGPGQEDN